MKIKKIAIFFICVFFSFGVYAQKPLPFSRREKTCLRVGTPGLFDQTNLIYIHLDSLSDEEFVFPLPGAKLISKYGKRGTYYFHTGVDLKTCPRDTIFSVFAGRVRMSKPFSSYGNIVVIRHATGLETVYAHNSKNLVKCGDLVKAGSPIALTGRTGRATTSHLHFETRIDGCRFNPEIILDIKNRRGAKICIQCERNKNGISVKPFFIIKKIPSVNVVKVKDDDSLFKIVNNSLLMKKSSIPSLLK